MCKIEKMLVDLKTKQENGTFTLCPRCGLSLTRGAEPKKSRIADILICKQCAIQETGLEKMSNEDDVYSWFALQPKKPNGDFKAVKGATAWDRIAETQKSTIFELYRKSETEAHWGELNYEAQERLPGLTSCSFRPFYLRYKVLDGVLVVRVNEDLDGPVLTGAMADC